MNGSLINHLVGTFKLLKSWKAAEYLCDAGLFHAAYGTAAFDDAMVSLNRRSDIEKVISIDAEALVYLYCSCDREYVFEKKIASLPIQFKDRFTGETFTLTASQARAFCELTVANELELIIASDEFAAQYGAELFTLFENIEYYLSDRAIEAYRSALTDLCVSTSYL